MIEYPLAYDWLGWYAYSHSSRDELERVEMAILTSIKTEEVYWFSEEISEYVH